VPAALAAQVAGGVLFEIGIDAVDEMLLQRSSSAP